MEQRSDIYSAVEDFSNRYVRPAVGRTLVAGSRIYAGRPDWRKRHDNAEGWDMSKGDGVDRIVNLEEALPVDAGEFDHVECISVLEHAKNPWAIAKNLERLLRKGGTLFLTVPFIWRVHAYPSDYWRFTVEGVRLLFSSIAWDAILYAHCVLTEDTKSRAVSVQDYPYLARTQVCAFGRMQ